VLYCTIYIYYSYQNSNTYGSYGL